MLAMTTDFHGESRKSEEIRGALSRIAKAGFSHVHWCHECGGSYLYSIHEMLQIRGHTLPFEGVFDWAGFAPLLARSPYKFPILMEPICREEGDDTAWLNKAFEVGNRFSAMVEKHRK